MEMSNVFLKAGGKAILVQSGKELGLNCVHVLVFCGR